MAFEYLQSLVLDPDFDRDDESDIEIEQTGGDISDNDDDGDNDSGPRSRSSSSSSNGTDEEWSSNLSTVTDKIEPFTEYAGPVHDLPEDSDPLEYFKLFFPTSMIELFVEETNKYAEQQSCVAKNARPQEALFPVRKG